MLFNVICSSFSCSWVAIGRERTARYQIRSPYASSFVSMFEHRMNRTLLLGICNEILSSKSCPLKDQSHRLSNTSHSVFYFQIYF